MKKFRLLICRASFTAVILIFPCKLAVAGAESGQMDHIARLIFHNECNGREACLTSWNKGEEFASLGIGHFIWYPQGTPENNKHFSESFPGLIYFMRQQGVVIPAWIHADQGCPWQNRKVLRKYAKNTKNDGITSVFNQNYAISGLFYAKTPETGTSPDTRPCAGETA
jgi:hypothetical protein